MSHSSSYLPYHEPGIVEILIIASFLLALNLVNSALDNLIYCGLIGQIFIGVAWGTPGAGWLSQALEEAIVQFGYIGLILLVFEGGLDTNYKSVKANIGLSTVVAFTGILFPMGLSFILIPLMNATVLQSFAAGAALCSTSLGTTFTILSTTGLSSTRLGIVLTSSAMLDDVVGLVLVQVISNLGNKGFNAITVVRPVAVSMGLIIAVPLICRSVARPLTSKLHIRRITTPRGLVSRIMTLEHLPLIMHTSILLALVTGATYAGTSNLFAAYLAGASVSWWDAEVSDLQDRSPGQVHKSPRSRKKQPSTASEMRCHPPEASQVVTTPLPRGIPDLFSPGSSQNRKAGRSGKEVFHTYYATSLQRILKPLFFASIGFAIPITDMFSSHIVWRGIIYTILMGFAKLVTGVWLVRFNISLPSFTSPRSLHKYLGSNSAAKNSPSTEPHEFSPRTQAENSNTAPTPQISATSSITPNNAVSQFQTSTQPRKAALKPLSLYPASLLGTAMTARGEIGFLIASLAETSGLFTSIGKSRTGSSQIYLVVVWDIVLCTALGPLGTGVLVKRVRRLQVKGWRILLSRNLWGLGVLT